MTKYVLQSGGLKKQPEKAKKYFTELLKGLGDFPKLLWCFFAELPEDSNERFQLYTKLFESYIPKDIHPINTDAVLDTCKEQVAECDAVYMHGGDTEVLYDILKDFDIDELFTGKTVGTNSASSLVLAENGWSSDRRKIVDGFGVLPIKFIAHYKSDHGNDDPRRPVDWEAAYKELEAYGDTSLPIYALEEGEFIVMEK